MAEQYTELYKKRRPRVWNDIIGQDSIVSSLRESVLNKKIPTGYMFFGPHGCGKTSSAFILAKALNCENVDETGNPCNTCDTCTSIDNKTQLGIRYISMANQGTAEDIRKIVNEAQLRQPIKKQVWILDECHQLSRTAWDSLLIPLESEKAQTLFIFCSTEPDKIPKTILSRLQTRTFNPVGVQDLARNLKKITVEEKIQVTDEQILLAARSAGGSVRDSVSYLETLATHGILPEQYSEKVLRLLASTKYTDIYLLTNEMSANGQNFGDAAQQLYSDLSNILIMLAGGKPAVLYPGMTEVAKELTPQLVITYLNILGSTIDSMSRNTVDSRILFDICMSSLVTARRKIEGVKK